MCRRSRSRGSAAIASCGVKRPIPVRQALYGSRGVCIGPHRAITRSVLWELRAGIIEGSWTPLAAKQATWVVAHLTPQEGEELFGLLGGMKPSKSSLDRLPKDVSARWEKERVK